MSGQGFVLLSAIYQMFCPLPNSDSHHF